MSELTAEQIERGAPNISEHGAVGPDAVAIFRATVLVSGLKLEIKGIKSRRGRSCYAIVKQEYGLKGNKLKVYNELVSLLKLRGLKLSDSFVALK